MQSKRGRAPIEESAERKCYLCGEPGEVHVHHIDLDDHNNTTDNLIDLCASCRKAVNRAANMNRDELLSIRKEISEKVVRIST
jgi:5-methylcytosine-specific restriction endonuclease McrA